jgi:hypothetical protein
MLVSETGKTLINSQSWKKSYAFMSHFLVYFLSVISCNNIKIKAKGKNGIRKAALIKTDSIAKVSF